jgi:hypothetical protein
MLLSIISAVMRAAMIDITDDEQRKIVRRLFHESGNVNVQTKDVNLCLVRLEIVHVCHSFRVNKQH